MFIRLAPDLLYCNYPSEKQQGISEILSYNHCVYHTLVFSREDKLPKAFDREFNIGSGLDGCKREMRTL